jgi:hypothetical protein
MKGKRGVSLTLAMGERNEFEHYTNHQPNEPQGGVKNRRNAAATPAACVYCA